jgi:hypothetical protein
MMRVGASHTTLRTTQLGDRSSRLAMRYRGLKANKMSGGAAPVLQERWQWSACWAFSPLAPNLGSSALCSKPLARTEPREACRGLLRIEGGESPDSPCGEAWLGSSLVCVLEGAKKKFGEGKPIQAKGRVHGRAKR